MRLTKILQDLMNIGGKAQATVASKPPKPKKATTARPESPTPTAGVQAQESAREIPWEDIAGHNAAVVAQLKKGIVDIIRALPKDCRVWQNMNGERVTQFEDELIDPIRSLASTVVEYSLLVSDRLKSAEETVERVRRLASEDCVAIGRQRDELRREVADLKRAADVHIANVEHWRDVSHNYRSEIRRIAQELGTTCEELDHLLYLIRLNRSGK